MSFLIGVGLLIAGACNTRSWWCGPLSFAGCAYLVFWYGGW